jgi:hypothetical protein
MNHFVQFHLTSQQQKINRFFSVKKIQGLEGSLPNWISATVEKLQYSPPTRQLLEKSKWCSRIWLRNTKFCSTLVPREQKYESSRIDLRERSSHTEAATTHHKHYHRYLLMNCSTNDFFLRLSNRGEVLEEVGKVKIYFWHTRRSVAKRKSCTEEVETVKECPRRAGSGLS